MPGSTTRTGAFLEEWGNGEEWGMWGVVSRFFADEEEDARTVVRDVDLKEAKTTFRDFIRQFHTGGFQHIYRSALAPT